MKKSNGFNLPLTGIIVDVVTQQEMDTYTLDNSYTWSDSKGRHQEGDEVRITPYIMGTVKVEKL